MQKKTNINVGAYDYYAFISYSHRDKAFARWLQKSLEHSRIPAAIHRGDSGVTKKISPIFRDDTDLVNHSSLSKDLRNELEKSRFLILICSPASAQSDWVNDEVRTFIELGRTDRIIPVILSGTPDGGDPATECFPPALRALDRDTKPLGVSVPEYGRRGCCLRVIASLLDIRLNQIIDRDKIIRRRRRLARAVSAAFLCAALGFLLWYNVPVKSYYRDYTYRWDLPVGLDRVSAAERKCRGNTYCFTAKRGRVIAVERKNAAGSVADPELVQLWTEPSVVRFSYEDIGLFGKKSLSSKEYYSSGGKKLLSLQYSIADGSGTRAVDLIAPDLGSSAAGAVAYTTDLAMAATSDFDELTTIRCIVSRYLQSYDAEGRMTARTYMRDNWNHPVSDADGIYGLRYAYTEDGRIAAVQFLDQNGTATAGERYAYDGNGNLTECVKSDASGEPVVSDASYVYQRLTYDRYGRVTELRNYDNEEKAMPSADLLNAAAMRTEYDGQGNPVRIIFLDETDQPAPNAAGYAEICRQYNAEGFMTEEQYLDTEGKPAVCGDGVAKRTFAYDPDGNVTLLSFFDGGGTPVKDPAADCCAIAFRYNGGRIAREEYLDENGRPYVTRNGYAAKERGYNEAGQMSRIVYLDADGQPTAAENGAYSVTAEYRESALSQLRYCDENGKPVTNLFGYSACCFEREEGLLTGISYLDPQDRPTTPYADCWSREELVYDEAARLTEEWFYDETGAPTRTKGDYAAIRYDWAADRASFKQYLDEDRRQITPDPEKAARRSATTVLFLVTGLTPDSPAERAGLKCADIFLRYNDWDYADYCADAQLAVDTFSETMAQSRETTKNVRVLRRSGEGNTQTETMLLPEGITGFSCSSAAASVAYAERFLFGLPS